MPRLKDWMECRVDDDLTVRTPPGFEGLSNEQAISLCATMLRRWSHLIAEEMERDCVRLNSLDLFEQLCLRAKWDKQLDLILNSSTAMEKYETPRGKLDLIAQKFGDQIGLPAQSLAADVEQRLQWYKQRVASVFEHAVKSDVNFHSVTSPIEQIFLMEWRFLRIDESLDVVIKPQSTFEFDGKKYRIDFVVGWADQKQKVAIEIDGHEFHEKTKAQAARDRARERSIIRGGYTIMRFTGSEVFSDPRRCVQEVAAFILAQKPA